MKLTVVIEKSDDGWFVGQLEELPEVLAQAQTIKELKTNLREALHVLLDPIDNIRKLSMRIKRSFESRWK